ncbi:MAG: AAA family ATPase [Phocaeicola sp.]
MKSNKLTIRNIGPIKDIEINLNKINLFIGAQGSGKSTIVKIISFCSWVEKRVALNRNGAYFLKDNIFFDRLVSFHKLYGYFKDDSMIEYESEVLKITYKQEDKKPHIEIKELNQYKRTKVSYIPAERNIVAAIPNWFEVKLPDNNILSFMADWESARKRRSDVNRLSLLKNSITYHYDEQKGDIVTLGENLQLSMTNTASGFQSAIPLFVVAEYVTRNIYEKEANGSIESLNKWSEIQFAIFQELLEGVDPTTAAERVKEDIKNNNLEGDYIKKFIRSQDIADELTQTKQTKIIVEEIEQNLFPETQIDALYQIFTLAKDDKVSLALTTHSPYVLFAINNCLLGGKVKEQIPAEEANQFASSAAWIDPTLVSIWQINNDGKVEDLKNEKLGTIKKHYFSEITHQVMNEYYELTNYIDNEE